MKILTVLLISCVVLISCENKEFLSIDITDQWTTVKLTKPFKTINSGAALFVDVTTMVNSKNDMYAIQKMFPPGVILAVLKSSDGVDFVFANEDSFVRQDGRTEIKLSSKSALKAGLRFVELKIKSNGIKFNKATVRWISYGL